MNRRVFIVRTLGTFAVAARAGRPAAVLARGGVLRRTGIRPHPRLAGALRGCSARRSSPLGGYRYADAVGGRFG